MEVLGKASNFRRVSMVALKQAGLGQIGGGPDLFECRTPVAECLIVISKNREHACRVEFRISEEFCWEILPFVNDQMIFLRKSGAPCESVQHLFPVPVV